LLFATAGSPFGWRVFPGGALSLFEVSTWPGQDHYYVYTFTVSSGKVYQLTATSCSNGDTIGARETIWYQPADPTQFLTANEWTFDWIFFLGFSIPMLLFAFAFFRRLFRWLFAPSRRFTEVQRG
jgi:hypothetical protein